MKELPPELASVDWSLTTWEGARREQMRRWAALPLDRIVASLEEMATLVGPSSADPLPHDGDRDPGPKSDSPAADLDATSEDHS